MNNKDGNFLVTFEEGIICRDSWGSIENWLEPETKTSVTKLNQVKHVQICDAHFTVKMKLYGFPFLPYFKINL